MKRLLIPILLLVALGAAAQFSPKFAEPFGSARRQYVEALLKADSPTRTYALGQKATAELEVYLGGLPAEGLEVECETGEEMMPGAKSKTTLHGGRAIIDLGTRTEPGFRQLRIAYTVGGKIYKDLMKVGFGVEAIRPLTPCPADLRAFWAKTVKAARKTALDPIVKVYPELSTDKVEVALVRLTVGPAGRHIWGWLTRPKDGKKHPVLFCPPGAGQSRQSPTLFYSQRGYIYLNITIHSTLDPTLAEEDYKAERDKLEGYNRFGIASRDSFYYRDVYAGCVRCVDWLCSLPDWDGRNVGVTGGSQGGALSLTTAALHGGVTFCAPFYPALCDLMGYRLGRAGGWPGYWRKAGEVQGAEATLPYYDVANLCRLITCPVYFAFGFNDETCCPTSTYAAYNSIAAPKTLRTTATNGHWRFAETNAECLEWMDRQTKL